MNNFRNISDEYIDKYKHNEENIENQSKISNNIKIKYSEDTTGTISGWR